MPFNQFNLFPNKYFIETGSYYGDGIQEALNSGFKYITSIEITEKYYEHCKNRYINNPEVTLVYGDTVEKLPEVISRISEPVTFFLDGHWDITSDETRGELDFPILKELEIISNHPIKNHTLIIDDVRCFTTYWGIDHRDVIFSILKINPNYVISYEDGLSGRLSDVLIAKV